MIEKCPKSNEACPYWSVRPRGPLRGTVDNGCFADEDHYYWPARNYRTEVEAQFRELPENREMKCRDEHDERHRNEFPPPKPDLLTMLQALNRSQEDEQRAA